MRRLILFILIVISALQVNAQNHGPQLSVGTIEIGRKTPILIAELLRDPRIISDDTSYKVMEYEVSIKVNRSDILLGPYKIQGGTLEQ